MLSRSATGFTEMTTIRASWQAAGDALGRALPVVAVKRAVEVHDRRGLPPARPAAERLRDRLGHRLVLDALGEVVALGGAARFVA